MTPSSLNKALGLITTSLALPLLLAPAASALTQSASFNPVLIVDGDTGSTGFTFSGLTTPVAKVVTTINLTKCDDPIDSATGACIGTGFSFNEEIGFSLISPTGTIVSLVIPYTDLDGQTPGNTVTWKFDDSAFSIVSGDFLIPGTYLPKSPLSAFNGEDGNGLWQLLYTDDSGDDPLSVNSWSLTVMNEVPGPLPFLGAAAAFGFSRRIRRRLATSRPQD